MKKGWSSGFTLIEVAISLVLATFALLYLLNSQSCINKLLEQVGYKHIAMQQALSIIERLKVNNNKPYINREIASWQRETANVLPMGVGSVIHVNDENEISISWQNNNQQAILKLSTTQH